MKSIPLKFIMAITLAAVPAVHAAPAAAPAATTANVTVQEDATSFTLSNGIMTARVSKRNGDLQSLQYKGIETLEFNSGHAGAYWSHDTTGGVETRSKITLSPEATKGERVEVSVKGISGGRKMGHGPGAAEGGDFPADIEIRYSLGRGDSGIYTYCIFDHLPEYPAATMTEARFCAKVAETFDWLTLDDKRDMAYPRELNQGDKYIYTAIQFDHPAYGWTSTKQNLGFWLLNPSMEYLSGGPTKVEFLCHRDTTQVAAGCVHNYWRSSHYGGAAVEVGAGERWTKVIGPFLLYVNSSDNRPALFKDALVQAAKETAKWPYAWVAGVDYPLKEQRATVKGRLALTDSQASSSKLPNLLVGLTPASYTSPYAGINGPRQIDWQTDAKHYEFWVRGDENGTFSIPNVRPGTYTLRAFADGVLGEYARANVTIEPGKPLDLGKIEWVPLRYGRQVWDIGVPNRNGSEFFMAENFADPEISIKYPAFFPNDVNYVIGKSDFRKDWFFQHVPHNTDPAARAVPFSGIRGEDGKATPYAISFDLPSAPKGTAILRLAISGTGARRIFITVNDQPAGTLWGMPGDGAITRHSIQGLWYARDVSIDAKLLKQGANVIKLTVPAGPVNDGVIYDYVRLELNEAAPFPTPAGS